MDPFGSAALNALRVQFGGNLYLLRRYDWIHRVMSKPDETKLEWNHFISSVNMCFFSESRYAEPLNRNKSQFDW